MLHRRIYQFFIIYFLGLSLLLLLKYAADLSDYVIPGPTDIWQTGLEVYRRYFSDVIDTLSVAIIGQVLSRSYSKNPHQARFLGPDQSRISAI